MEPFTALPDLVLGPLAGRSDADWYQAPPGKWNSAQIVEHLALALEGSGRGFEQRRAHAPMQRRRRTPVEFALRSIVVGMGWFPPGATAPKVSTPPAQVDRGHAEAHFREGVARFIELAPALLPARTADLFVKHPRFGDLTFEEWMRFHVIHARHHAKQIRARLPR